MQREYTTIELASNYAGNNIHLTHDVNNAEGIHINIVSLTFRRKQYSPYARCKQMQREYT